MKLTCKESGLAVGWIWWAPEHIQWGESKKKTLAVLNQYSIYIKRGELPNDGCRRRCKGYFSQLSMPFAPHLLDAFQFFPPSAIPCKAPTSKAIKTKPQTRPIRYHPSQEKMTQAKKKGRLKCVQVES